MLSRSPRLGKGIRWLEFPSNPKQPSIAAGQCSGMGCNFANFFFLVRWEGCKIDANCIERESVSNSNFFLKQRILTAGISDGLVRAVGAVRDVVAFAAVLDTPGAVAATPVAWLTDVCAKRPETIIWNGEISTVQCDRRRWLVTRKSRTKKCVNRPRKCDAQATPTRTRHTHVHARKCDAHAHTLAYKNETRDEYARQGLEDQVTEFRREPLRWQTYGRRPRRLNSRGGRRRPRPGECSGRRST